MQLIEPLESRIAPATIINPTTVTYQDVDGDTVTIKLSKPLFNDANVGNIADILVFDIDGVGGSNDLKQQLQAIDLTKLSSLAAAKGVNITVSAKRSPVNGGDGFVNVGAIFAQDIDLGTVTIKGDLGQIDAGDAATMGIALNALNVQSMGEFGTSTQAGGGDLFSQMNGTIGSINVPGNVRGAEIRAIGADGLINKVTIGGSLIGIDSVLLSGRIFADIKIASVVIKGSLIGANVIGTGALEAGEMGSVTIGSIIGGTGDFSGRVGSSFNMGAVKIATDIRGSSGEMSGSIGVEGILKLLTIGGSLIGGSGAYDSTDHEGQIFVEGKMGPVKIGGNIVGGGGEYSGAINTQDGIPSLTINGSIFGGGGDGSGSVVSTNAMGVVKIGGNVLGDTGADSGLINPGGDITSLTIGGALRGGSGIVTGVVFADSVGTIKVGSIEGGAGIFGGYISADDVKSITVAGSIIGGSGSASGFIDAGDVGSVVINGDIRGGSASGATDLTSSGYLQATSFGKVTIKGSLFAGEDSTTGVFGKNGGIFAIKNIGSLTIKGGVFGKVGESGDVNHAFITAEGQAVPGLTTDIAIGSITVGGNVELAQILAGFDPNQAVMNADAQIGKITVGGDWISSSVSAGVDPVDGFFGDNGDVLIDEFAATGSFDAEDIFSKIGSILIKGAAYGTIEGTDHYGFTAHEIGSVKIGAVSYPLASGLGNDFDGITVGPTGDVRIREVPLVT